MITKYAVETYRVLWSISCCRGWWKHLWGAYVRTEAKWCLVRWRNEEVGVERWEHKCKDPVAERNMVCLRACWKISNSRAQGREGRGTLWSLMKGKSIVPTAMLHNDLFLRSESQFMLWNLKIFFLRIMINILKPISMVMSMPLCWANLITPDSNCCLTTTKPVPEYPPTRAQACGQTGCLDSGLQIWLWPRGRKKKKPDKFKWRKLLPCVWFESKQNNFLFKFGLKSYFTANLVLCIVIH
jgi:hypothetical protein